MVPLSLANRPPGSFWRPGSGSVFLSVVLDEFFWHSDVMWLALRSYNFCRWPLPPQLDHPCIQPVHPRLFLSFSFSPSMSLCHGLLIYPASLSLLLPVIFFFQFLVQLFSLVSMCGRERSYWPTFAGLGMVHSLPPLSPGTAQEDPTTSTAERDMPRQLPTVNHRGQCWIILRENEGHS